MGVIRWSLLGLCLAAAATAACGDGMSDSPTSPSPGGFVSGGAVISGLVNGSTASTPPSNTASTQALSTLTISVVGTGISTTTDSSGRFTLTGVPSGTVQLALTGPGTNAQITIAGISEGDRIDVTITLANGRASVASEQRSRGVDVTGRITELNTAARMLRVAGTLVSVPAAAVIRHGGRTMSFSQLSVGDHVVIKGNMDGTTLVATEVKVQEGDDDDDDDDNDGDAEAEGVVAGLTGNCPTLSFTLGATRVMTNTATRFKGGNCSRVVNGARVEAEGRRQADGSILASEVEIDH